MNLLILTHDPVETLDRRIVNEARVFVENGWSVRVVLTAYGGDGMPRLLEPGIILHPVPLRRIEPVYDPEFEAAAERTASRLAGRHLIRASVLQEMNVAGRLQELTSWLDTLPGPASRFQRAINRAGRGLKRIAAALRRMLSAQGNATSDEDAERNAASWYPLPFTTSFLRASLPLKSDAIMACDLPALPAALRLSLAWNVPLIYDSHELYVEQNVFTTRQKAILAHHEREGLERAAVSFVVSEPIADELRDKYDLRERPRVLYNAPMFRHRSEDVDSTRVRHELGLRPGERYLLYHGGLVQGRNLERLVTGFADLGLPAWRLVMLGYGDLYSRIETLARRWPDRVSVHPAVPQDDLVHWVSGAEACVIPYLTEEKAYEFALPNKLFDCIELGTPVIANERLVAIGRIVEEFPIGFLGPMESDEQMRDTLRHGLRRLEGDDRCRGAMKRCRDRYGWNAQRTVFWEAMEEAGLFASSYRRRESA